MIYHNISYGDYGHLLSSERLYSGSIPELTS
nr:MAG TPA: hypothetical protein [Caudoviricetes sp.]